jgi:hypothetical protein
MSPVPRPQKITLSEMRLAGIRGLLIYCADYRCSHWMAISGDRWSDNVRLSDLESRFVCQACGGRGAEVRPDFDYNRKAPADQPPLNLSGQSRRAEDRPIFE